jgi:hypothetical protein
MAEQQHAGATSMRAGDVMTENAICVDQGAPVKSVESHLRPLPAAVNMGV